MNQPSRRGESTVWGGSWGDASPALFHGSRILDATLSLVPSVYCSWRRLVTCLSSSSWAFKASVFRSQSVASFSCLSPWHLPALVVLLTALLSPLHSCCSFCQADLSSPSHPGKDFFQYPQCHARHGCFVKFLWLY